MQEGYERSDACFFLIVAILRNVFELMGIAVECDDGEVRLLEAERRGQVEVCMNKRWLTVCGNGWNSVAASAMCRQLGYGNGKCYNMALQSI